MSGSDVLIWISSSLRPWMFRIDRNRELADEECILRSDDWEYEPCTWVNWARASAIGKATAKEFQSAYVDFVALRMEGMQSSG